MSDYDDDDEFNSQQIQEIMKNQLDNIIGSPDMTYQRDKVNQWTQQIIEGCLKELVKLNKQFKYAVTCVFQQNNGAGLYSAATTHWNEKSDGLSSVCYTHSSYTCILTVFGMQI